MANFTIVKGGYDKEKQYELLKNIVDKVRNLESEISWIERNVKKTNNENLKDAFQTMRLNMVQVLKISIDTFKLLDLELMNKDRRQKYDHLKLVSNDE